MCPDNGRARLQQNSMHLIYRWLREVIDSIVLISSRVRLLSCISCPDDCEHHADIVMNVECYFFVWPIHQVNSLLFYLRSAPEYPPSKLLPLFSYGCGAYHLISIIGSLVVLNQNKLIGSICRYSPNWKNFGKLISYGWRSFPCKKRKF